LIDPTTSLPGILLADDEEGIRMLLRPPLENAGYDVISNPRAEGQTGRGRNGVHHRRWPVGHDVRRRSTEVIGDGIAGQVMLSETR
jgi:hypothetical protein